MTVDRIFLDANILFSVAYGSPGLNRLWIFAHQKRCRLFASRFVVEEAKRNLSHPEQKKRLEDSLSEVQIVPEADPTLPCPIDLPEKDRPVLMAALSNKVDYLMTGDSTHFGKYFGQTVSGVKICRPRDYLVKPRRKEK
ncbi:MAG TPA: PIN domain-containing protein [Thermodesulfobacteriota bacterium]|nr:PIN domain-containing protein [Thermodesulfobacteriota bacterium]